MSALLGSIIDNVSAYRPIVPSIINSLFGLPTVGTNGRQNTRCEVENGQAVEESN
jgi:hypothetical protein